MLRAFHKVLSPAFGHATSVLTYVSPQRLAWLTAALLGLGFSPPEAVAITINLEYTNEGDPVPHDENPSWDPDGTILKAHFQAAKQIWEALLPGEGEYTFDFQWDDDIDGLGLTTLSGIDDFVEINPTYNWFADPTPNDSSEFGVPNQTLYGQLPSDVKITYFPGAAPPNGLEVGYRGAGASSINGVGGFNSMNGYDLLSTVVHEIGHVLGLSGIEPGEYNIFPQHVGGIEDVLILEGDGGHLAGQGIVPYLMCENCGSPGVRRFPTATDILVIAEDQDITDVHLARVGSTSAGSWSEPLRWIGGKVPDGTQDIYVAHGAGLTVSAAAVAQNLHIDGGNSINVVSSTLTVAGMLANDGNLTLAPNTTLQADSIVGNPAGLATAAGSLVRFNNLAPGTSAATAATFNGSVAIGHGVPTAGAVTLASGTIKSWTIAQNLTIGESRAAIVNVANAAAWNVGGNLTVGTVGGELHVQTGGAVAVAGNLQVVGGSGPSAVKVAQAATLNVAGQINVNTNGRVAYTNANPQAAAINIGGGVTSVVSIPWPGTSYEVTGIGGAVTIDGTPLIESRTTPINVAGGVGNDAAGGLLTFKGAAYAMSYQIVNQGGEKGGSLSYGTRAGLGGETRFEGTSRAWSANIRNDAVLTDRGGRGGRTTFVDSSGASQATINNYGTTTADYRASGTTEFYNSASAATANITNHPTNAYQDVANASTAPRTVFNGTSTASNATLANLGGTAAMWQGGRTIFRENSTAGSATIINFGSATVSEYRVGATEFRDNSTAGSATLRLKTGGARVDFRENASAGDAEFIVENSSTASAGQMTFYNNSKAGAAQFTFEPSANGALLYFIDNASAEQANFDLKGDSSKLRFQGSSTAAQATFDIAALTAVQFNSNANLGDATFTVRRNGHLDLAGGYNPTGAPSVSAGAATIDLEGAAVAGGASAGLGVSTWSGVGNATITVGGGTAVNAPGAYAEFDYVGHGENATIIVKSGEVPGALGGNLIFRRGANGENARVINQQGGYVDVRGNNGHIPKTTMGSIEGAGTILLSGVELETGSRNTNDVISGPILDIPSSGLGGMLTKVGTGTLTLSGANTYTGLTTVNAGRVLINGSNVGGAAVNNGATLGGTGVLGGTVTVNTGGTLAPGALAGKLTVGGLTLAGGSVAMEVGGTAAGTQYDQLLSTGAFSLAGPLSVSLVNGFTPVAGSSFNLFDWGSLSGTFSSLSLPSLVGLSWDTSQLYTTGILAVAAATSLAGDYNQNGVVDAADYTLWRDRLGSSTPLPNDDTPGVTAADYTRWKANFGNTAGAGGLAGQSSSPAPEPSVLQLTVVGLALLACRARSVFLQRVSRTMRQS